MCLEFLIHNLSLEFCKNTEILGWIKIKNGSHKKRFNLELQKKIIFPVQNRKHKLDQVSKLHQ